ncbi:Glycosyl transferase family 2 [Novipirellula aureliae]|uniref:Glycosyl transferase family 2 n=1 Tax=Novipirellula aureliae TaxID=2527966 RepID=A0A5C6E1D8_9BACT|nr:glycosyltransferase family 2 protein [Novipirellula aureliae]TWU41186.1 Glycosyl transferase family 2 [Novipirellula aureliae]
MLSIAILTAKKPQDVIRVLRSIERAKSGDFEILVIANANFDAWQDSDLVSKFPSVCLRVIEEPIPGLLAARHRAVSESEGVVVCFLDDDVTVSESWMDSLQRNFSDPLVTLVGGPSSPRYESAPPSWLDSFFVHERQKRYCTYISILDCGSQRIEIDPMFIWGLNLAIRKSYLKDIGGFHPDGVPWHLRRFRGDGETGIAYAMNERMEFGIYDPETAVVHEIPTTRLTVSYFKRRAYLQGISDSYTHLRGKTFENAPQIPLPRNLSRRERLSWAFKKGFECVRKSNDLVQLETKSAYRNGYMYHQSQYQNDPDVREWVVRPDYWNYAYPRNLEISKT